jgi:hypothetical protein
VEEHHRRRIGRAPFLVEELETADAFGLKTFPNADELFVTSFPPPQKDRRL